MVLWKNWFDIRIRFYLALLFVVLNVTLLIVVFPLLGPVLSWAKADIPASDWKTIQPYLASYRLFMDQNWFQKVGILVAISIVFGLGGIMSERKSRSILLSLSLPVPRYQWILFHAALAVALLLILNLTASVTIILGGFALGEPYPIGRALQGAVLQVLPGLCWVGATLALTSITGDKLRTALIMFGIWFCMSILDHIPSISVWLPHHVMDLLKGNNFPWRAFLTIFVAGFGGLFLATQKFMTEDY
jgi:ABC-type transport system involved in multi-copper enzyme maturation permease subunit